MDIEDWRAKFNESIAEALEWHAVREFNTGDNIIACDTVWLWELGIRVEEDITHGQ